MKTRKRLAQGGQSWSCGCKSSDWEWMKAAAVGYRTTKDLLWSACVAVAAGLWYDFREQWYLSVWKSFHVPRRRRRMISTRKT